MSERPKPPPSAPASSESPPKSHALARRPSGPTCTALKRNGDPCGGGATAASGYAYCPWHDPQTTEDQRMAWATKGGVAATRATVIPAAPDPELSDPEKIRAFIQETAGRVLRGDISPAVGATLTGLARAALTAYEHNLLQKLAHLEEVAAAQAKSVGWRRVSR